MKARTASGLALVIRAWITSVKKMVVKPLARRVARSARALLPFLTCQSRINKRFHYANFDLNMIQI